MSLRPSPAPFPDPLLRKPPTSSSQIMLDCASPGPPSRPNTLLLRERAARALSLVCLCAGATPASSVVLAGLVLLLQCRDAGVVGEAAAAALWALCHAPVNRKALSKMRYVFWGGRAQVNEQELNHNHLVHVHVNSSMSTRTHIFHLERVFMFEGRRYVASASLLPPSKCLPSCI